MFAVAVLLGVIGYAMMYAGLKDVPMLTLLTLKGTPAKGSSSQAPTSHRQPTRVGGGRSG